eukprot:GILJ01006536.1.p1 GENE.GILJ01006536.1~~GILJ01006536.1.p1  ORF type:complete len:290 (+),score=53.18 GILJ01006536.1:40-909(+)
MGRLAAKRRIKSVDPFCKKPRPLAHLKQQPRDVAPRKADTIKDEEFFAPLPQPLSRKERRALAHTKHDKVADDPVTSIEPPSKKRKLDADHTFSVSQKLFQKLLVEGPVKMSRRSTEVKEPTKPAESVIEGIRPGESFASFSKRMKREVRQVLMTEGKNDKRINEKKKEYYEKRKQKLQEKKGKSQQRTAERAMDAEVHKTEQISFGETAERPPDLQVIQHNLKTKAKLALKEKEKEQEAVRREEAIELQRRLFGQKGVSTYLEMEKRRSDMTMRAQRDVAMFSTRNKK